jgi:RHS repeat-associated protein
MKTKCHIITAAVIALTVFTQTSHAISDLPAPKPEFLSQEQLAKWNADQGATKAQRTKDLENYPSKGGVSFFTGKPFDSISSSYLFKYRAYDSELNRWTTPDPSGFPDGPNNSIYTKNGPVSALDFEGLDTLHFGGHFEFGVGLWVDLTFQLALSFEGGTITSWGWNGSVTGGAVTGIVLDGGVVATYSGNQWIEQTSGVSGTFGGTVQLGASPFTLGYNLGNVTSGDYRTWTHSVNANVGGTFGLPAFPATGETGVTYTWTGEVPMTLDLWAIFE